MPAASPASATSRCARRSAASCSSANTRKASRVTQGQVLFRIDPATYQVALDRARGAARSRRRRRSARPRRTSTGPRNSFRRGVSTDKQRDEAAAAARPGPRQRPARRGRDRERQAQSRLHRRSTAPVAGVTALQSPPIGTLIQAQQTLLTTITPARSGLCELLVHRRAGPGLPGAQRRGAQKPITGEDLTRRAAFVRRRPSIPQPGKIDTAAQRVDPQTGTVQARAIFPNPDGALLPGQFVRVRIRGITLPDAIVIPQPGGEPRTARALGLRRRRERRRRGPADPPRPRGRGRLGGAGGTERRRTGRRRRRDPRPPGTAGQAGAALRRTQAHAGVRSHPADRRSGGARP